MNDTPHIGTKRTFLLTKFYTLQFVSHLQFKERNKVFEYIMNHLESTQKIHGTQIIYVKTLLIVINKFYDQIL